MTTPTPTPTPEQLKAKIASLRDDGLYETADYVEALAAQLAEAQADRDEWKQQHENLLSVRQIDIENLSSKIERLKTELDRRKGDPRTRLHNLCEALQEDLDKSPYTREEWEEVDRNTIELQSKLRQAEAAAASARETAVKIVEGMYLNSGGAILDADTLDAVIRALKSTPPAPATPSAREGDR